MTRREMFEKLATELFVQLAVRTAPLPHDASDVEADEFDEQSRARARQAIIAASAFMLEYADVADVVNQADANGDRLTGVGSEGRMQ